MRMRGNHQVLSKERFSRASKPKQYISNEPSLKVSPATDLTCRKYCDMNFKTPKLCIIEEQDTEPSNTPFRCFVPRIICPNANTSQSLVDIRRDSSGILATTCVIPGVTGTISYLTEISVYFGTSTSCGVSALSGLDPRYSLVRAGNC